MRKLAVLLLLATSCSRFACLTKPKPAPQPVEVAPIAPATVEGPAEIHGLTFDEETRILMLEDRREYDEETVNAWLANPNALHRQRMAVALARIGPATFVDANHNGVLDPGERQAGVAQLVKLTNDPSRDVRETAAFALGEIGDVTSLEALFTFAHDHDDAGVAAEAIEAISKFEERVPLSRYAELTADTLPEGVRGRAIAFLFRLKSDEASKLAMTALESTSPLIRQEGAYALSRRGYAPARERLELLLSDPTMLTRSYAAMALGRIGSRESITPLLATLNDPYPWVRTNIFAALARIAAKDPASIDRPTFKQDAQRVVDAVDDPDPNTRADSLEVLGWFAVKSELARTKLFELATSGSRWDREVAAGAIAHQFPDRLEELLPTSTPWMRVRMLEGIKDVKPQGAALRKRLAADPDPMVRANVAGNVPDSAVDPGPDSEHDLLVSMLDDTDVIVRSSAIDRLALARTKDVALLQAAEKRARNDQQDDARLSAINALAAAEFPERASFLRALLADNDPVVLRNAADDLEKLHLPRPQYTPLPMTRTAGEYAQIVEWSRQPHTATIHMTRGVIELQLLTSDAPITTWNFAQLARKHYFDATTFMRVVPNFVVQGGDPRNDMGGGPGYVIRDEINLQKYTRGAVGMALSGPDTGGSQFFITHSPQPHLDGGYTIFARVYEGMSGVVDQTERGDRVDSIGIDEHAPAAKTAVDGGAKPPLPTEIGPTSPARLLAIEPEYEQRKSSYEPDVTELEEIAHSLKPGDRLEVYLGTWCSDSQREVPKFFKIVDVLKAKYSIDLPVTYVAVDHAKQKPASLLDGKSVEKVATFIYYRNGQELGRIEEKPAGLLEDDLLAIAARP